MEDDNGENEAEFWAERTAILWECMKGFEAERFAAVLTLRWCKSHGYAKPSDTRWRLFAAGLTGREPTEPGKKDPDIKPDRDWW
jgi:hypothetical protein